MEKSRLVVIPFLLISAIIFSEEISRLPVEREHLVLTHTELGKYYCVSYLHHGIQNARYIIKQKNELFSEETRALQAVRELLGTHVANVAEIPSQKVWFVPADMPFVGKFFDNLVATLHAVVPGSMVKECPSWEHLDIRQRQLGKYGEGLSRQVIKSMSQHPDLPGIVALDTIGGNCGRHNKNYFYDVRSKRFYVIDMGGFYKRSHVVASCQNIERMINDHTVRFTEKEIRGIIAYRATLIRIGKSFDLRATLDKLNEFIEYAHLPAEIAGYVVHSISKCVIENYTSLHKLIHMLQALIDEKRHHHRAYDIGITD